MGDGDTPAGAAAFATEWAAAIAGTSYLPMEQAELEEFLAGLAVRLVAGLDAEPFDQRRGQQIGADLVAAHVTSPEGFGRTLEVIDARLLPDLGRSGARPRERLAGLLGAVATGYARALRDRTLDQQDSIRRATLFARQQAEAALRDSEARFRYQATHDPLTDLANRTLFTERLATLFAAVPPPEAVPGAGQEAEPAAGPRAVPGPGAAAAGAAPVRLGVCFLDLDGFKVVNDTLGHHVGDLLLVALADRLRQRLADHLVARLAGDEFVVLVEGTTCTDDVVKVADAALAAIAEPARVDGHELTISASIGIVEREIATTTPSEVMRAADVTLHWAKSAGRGRWAVFDPARNERELARYALSAAMPGALDRGEFFLEYQPLVSLATGAPFGVEALIRWRHPELGVLAPARFIDLAEETGLIVRLGGWALAEACRHARSWDSLRRDPPFVSVNLAMRQVRDPGLVETVTTVLEQTGLAPHRLQLEITESAVIGTDQEPARALRRLADLGVRIAIDDFGAGYSNLAYLRALPVCELKVAGSFMAGLREPAGAGTAPAGAAPAPADATADPGATDERILATLVSLAHTLGLTVTAEGVETAAQAERLRAIGCDAAQGRHFGPPTPYDRLAGLLSA